MDFSNPVATWTAGGAAFLIAIKVLWPLVKQFVETQTTQGRTESGLLNQVMAERNSALLRADVERDLRVKAEARADEHFEKMVNISAEFKVLTRQMEDQKIQLESYRSQIEKMSMKITELTELVESLKGGSHA